jgi:hypothetical protein
MAFLPFVQLLHHLEELDVERDEAANHTQDALHFLGLLRRKDYAQGGFAAALQHVLALLVEAGDNRIMVFEGDQ